MRRERFLMKNASKTAILLSVMSICCYSNCFASNVITQEHPDPGVYDRIDRYVSIYDDNKNDDSDEGLNIPFSGNTGDYVIINGGNIALIKKSSNAYGLWVSEGTIDGKPAATNLTVGGTININIDNSAYDKKGDKVFGVWKYGGYVPFPDAVQPEDQGGSIVLNNANISLIGKGSAYGLLAGSDFGGNSAGGGRIVVNGDLNVNATTLDKVGSGSMGKTFGAVACEGTIELNGSNSVFDVKAEQSDGYNNHEVAGLYTTSGGTVTSAENALVTLNVQNNSKNHNIIYGISSGYYDQVYTDYQGKSGVDLEGKTIINLKSEHGRAIGIHSSFKAVSKLNNVAINFFSDEKDLAAYRVGLTTQSDGIIDVESLYIGTGVSDVQNPNKIIALQNGYYQLEGKMDEPASLQNFLNEKGYKGSGTITVNKDGKGEVQIRGKVDSDNKGTIDVNMTSKTSYLYGNTKIGSNGGTINLALSNGARWINVQDTDDDSSVLTNLTLSNGGQIDMTDTVYTDVAAHKYQDIVIKNNFSGNGGSIHMDIDAATNVNNSDRVYVDGTHSGEHYITLNNVGANNNGAAGTVLVSVKDEQGTFKANDSEGTLYWNKYKLNIKDSETENYTKDWYLEKVEIVNPGDKPTTGVDTVLSVNSLNYHTWRTENDKLLQRMGELRHNGEEEKGAWFRVKGSKIGYDGGFENKYTTYELGYDEITKRTEEVVRYQGAALSYVDGKSRYSSGSGDNHGKAIGFYTTEEYSKGHYLDLVFKISNMDNDFKVLDTKGKRITGEYDNTGVSISAEYGRKNDLDHGWYIEPQVQLTLGYMGGANFETSNGIFVDQSGIKNALGRIGFNIGKKINERGIVYAKANLLHEFGGGYDVEMQAADGNLTVSNTYNDTWFEYGFGIAMATGDNSHIYFDIERSTGSDFYKDWQWNAGMRWNF